MLKAVVRKGHGLFVDPVDVPGLFARCGGPRSSLVLLLGARRAYVGGAHADFKSAIVDVDPALSIFAAMHADFALPISIFSSAPAIFVMPSAILSSVSAVSTLTSVCFLAKVENGNSVGEFPAAFPSSGEAAFDAMAG